MFAGLTMTGIFPFTFQTYFNDIWWVDISSEVTPAFSPPFRSNTDMMYDLVSQKIILFGWV